jgi:hypothetical protein
MATTTRASSERGTARAIDDMPDLVSGARSMADGVVGAAESVVNALPDAAASTRTALDEAARRLQGGSDEALTIGTAFSLGLATGLLLAGGNRLLILGSLIPMAAMGMTLLDRMGRSRGAALKQQQ